MFWKSGNKPGGGGAGKPGRAGRPWSLALRLTVWYAVSSLLLLLGTTSFMYWALLNRFDREDDLHLRSRVYELKQMFAVHAPDSAAPPLQVVVASRAQYPEPTYIRILSPEGTVLTETPGMSAAVPRAVFRQLPRDGGGMDVLSPAGDPYRAMTAAIIVGTPGQRYRVQIAVERRLEGQLIAQCRRWLGILFLIEAALCTAIGYWIARRGLRPARQMAAVVRGISPATLDQRIAAEAFPRELGCLAGGFNEMLRVLEDAFARLSRYSSDIAHELRTPIHNLRGEAEVALGRARTPAEYREALASCLEECVRLSSLIDRLLFLARAENPQTQIRRERLNIALELATLREFYSAVAAEAGLSLEMEADLGISADLDRQLFQQAVGNLVENAIANSPRGGDIRLVAGVEKGLLWVEVADSGRGIPPEHLAHIFERFYRVDATRSKQTGGLGLGLAIVKTIATLHGGSVHIASTPGAGTRVSLRFPVNAAAGAAAAAACPD